MAQENNPKTYQSLYEGIFLGGAADVNAMIEDEKCEVVVDLRAEAEADIKLIEGVTRIQVPLNNHSTESGQEAVIERAIKEVTTAYHNGKRIGFHCAAGMGRTGTVAIGTLLELGLFETIDEAEHEVQQIRSGVSINSAQREALKKLYPNAVKE
jgi:rhodanese-related sulfurtransferase